MLFNLILLFLHIYIYKIDSYFQNLIIYLKIRKSENQKIRKSENQK
tara:strand:+ start:948 stop:1085 length:138 start_codon:yes stop_codon:yes gene_type:complete